MKKLLLFLFLNFSLYSSQEQLKDLINFNFSLNLLSKFNNLTTNSSKFKYNTFADWYNICKQLPFYRDIYKSHGKNVFKSPDEQQDILPIEELNSVVNEYYKMILASPLANLQFWISDPPKENSDFFKMQERTIQPFIQKKILAPASIITFHADFHGDIHALLEMIKDLQNQGYMDKTNAFKIKNPNFNMFFLGDYVDRGNYSIEVVYTLLRLQLENPNNVFLIRGNHETPDINASYGFYNELKTKYKQGIFLWANMNKLFDFLPVAVYLGIKDIEHDQINFIQCCHGGLEIGFEPTILTIKPEENLQYQWINKLDSKKNIQILNIPQVMATEKINQERGNLTYNILGYMWSDFEVNPNGPPFYMPNRGFYYNNALTNKFLSQNSTSKIILKGVFRGHQHTQNYSAMMESILIHPQNDQANEGVSKLWAEQPIAKPYSLWDDIVCTFLVAPDTIYGIPKGSYKGFDYDAYGLLTTASAYENWELKIKRNYIFK